MAIATEYPEDLIFMTEAERTTGYSRTWIRARMKVWWKEGKQAVSKSELDKAVADFRTPKPKEGQEHEERR